MQRDASEVTGFEAGRHCSGRRSQGYGYPSAAGEAAVGAGVGLACGDGVSPGESCWAGHYAQSAGFEAYGYARLVFGVGELHDARGQQADRGDDRSEAGDVVDVSADALTRKVLVHDHLVGSSVEMAVLVKPPGQCHRPAGERRGRNVADAATAIVVAVPVVLDPAPQL